MLKFDTTDLSKNPSHQKTCGFVSLQNHY